MNQHADPNEDVCYSCPVLCEDKLSWGCAWVRYCACGYLSQWWSSQLAACVLLALICFMDWRKALDIIIRCRNRLKRTCRVRRASCIALTFIVWLYYSLWWRILAAEYFFHHPSCGWDFYWPPWGRILFVKGVAAVITGGHLGAAPAVIYFRNKRKRVGMKIEI